MYCRGNKLLDYGISTATSSNPRRRNKVKRRKAYYSRQRRTDIAVSLIKIFKFFAHKYFISDDLVQKNHRFISTKTYELYI